MFTIAQYVIFWMIVFVAIGAMWYVADKKYGTRIYRWWYNMTHKEPLPADAVVGFICNRSVKVRIAMAAMIGGLQSLTVMLTTEFNPIVELFMLAVEIPVTMIGFYCGPFLYGLWSKRDVVVNAIDRIETEGIHIPVEPVRESVKHVVSEVKGKILQVAASMSTKKAEEADATVQKPAVEVPVVAVDPNEAIRRYTERR